MKKLISHDVNDLMMFATQKDCKSLKEMILANPDAPLLIFVGDEANSGEYQYESCEAGLAVFKELTIYEDQWLDRDVYREQLEYDLADEEEYNPLSNDEFEAKIDEIVEETAFIRAIVIYVG